MRTVTPLNAGWQFARLETAALTPPAPCPALQNVALPHVWNRDDPGASGCCLYRCLLYTSRCV